MNVMWYVGKFNEATRELLLNKLDAEGVTPKRNIEIGSREAACAAGLGFTIIARGEIQDSFGIQVLCIK